MTAALSAAALVLAVTLATSAALQYSSDPPDVPAPRTDANSKLAHEQLLDKARQGRIDVYFVGDSITRRWGALDYPAFLEHWRASFHGWNAANFGWGADRTQNILSRLHNGELDGVNPKVIVILAGTNNVGNTVGGDAKVEMWWACQRSAMWAMAAGALLAVLTLGGAVAIAWLLTRAAL